MEDRDEGGSAKTLATNHQMTEWDDTDTDSANTSMVSEEGSTTDKEGTSKWPGPLRGKLAPSGKLISAPHSPIFFDAMKGTGSETKSHFAASSRCTTQTRRVRLRWPSSPTYQGARSARGHELGAVLLRRHARQGR